MIAAGQLRHRVTIQQLAAGSPQQKASGEPDVTWTDVLSCWASVEPLRGRELFAAQEHHSEITTRILLRGGSTTREGITAAMRVSFGGKLYNILAVLNKQERGIEIELLCGEGLNNG